ncbi:MAG: BrnA antitoxin family protein [Alphaproteobacteria bacterium]|nr:BrnA antitoxin family protein [Alphaproteobacteria bacterium]
MTARSSKTDWARLKREALKGIEPDMAHPDDAEASDRSIATAMAAKRRRGQRGPQKTPTKQSVNIRLSQEVLEHFKATGPGWQTRIDNALKKAAGV